MQAIYAAYASGAESYSSIAQDLNARGLRMHHWRDGDRPFGRESIRSILGNPAYRGQVTCKGLIADGRHVRPEGFERDVEKYNCATAEGWRVLRCTAKMLDADPAAFIGLLLDVMEVSE